MDAKAHAPGAKENLIVVEGAVEIAAGRERAVMPADSDAIVFGATSSTAP